MDSRSLIAIFAASFVFCCMATGEASVVEREKRDDNEWIVTTLIEQPYVSRKRTPAITNDDYDGYIPDVLKKIGEKLNQKYRIREVQDGKYGFYDEGRRAWTGMIGEVISSKAVLAAAPITINERRSAEVDFTTPFMTFGTVVLLKKPSNASVTPPKTVHELLDQSSLRYGAVRQGSTEQLLKSSSDPDLARLQTRLDGLETQEEGVSKVRNTNGKFAFVIEEKTANFWKRQEPCELITVPVTKLENRDYAFALRKGSPHTEKINKALKELKESGELDALEKKWWNGPCSGAHGIPQGSFFVTLAAIFGAIVHSIKF